MKDLDLILKKLNRLRTIQGKLLGHYRELRLMRETIDEMEELLKEAEE